MRPDSLRMIQAACRQPLPRVQPTTLLYLITTTYSSTKASRPSLSRQLQVTDTHESFQFSNSLTSLETTKNVVQLFWYPERVGLVALGPSTLKKLHTTFGSNQRGGKKRKKKEDMVIKKRRRESRNHYNIWLKNYLA